MAMAVSVRRHNEVKFADSRCLIYLQYNLQLCSFSMDPRMKKMYKIPLFVLLKVLRAVDSGIDKWI